MEENDVIEDIFGPDPNSSSSDTTKETEDDLFSQIEEHASGEPEANENRSSEDSLQSQGNVNDVNPSDDEFTDKALARVGIFDKNNIPWQDESGALFTRPWDSLTEEEQLDILSSVNTDPETDLDESEINLINTIRESGLDADTYMRRFMQEVQDRYVNQNQYFEIDDWTDDEVFAIDMLQRLGDQVTEEQIENALVRAKEDLPLFEKEVNQIRENYRTRQQEAAYRQQEEAARAQESRYQQYSNAVLQEIQQFNTVAGRPIELNFEDQNTLASYILQRDANGHSQYSYDMNSPQAVVQNAFWAIYGPQMLQEAESESARAFQRGYEQARRDLNSQAAVEIRSTNKRRSNYFNT